MSSAKKTIAIVLLILFLCTLAIVGIVFLMKDNYESNHATTIMTCSLNPSVKFVINNNNKVLTAMATNEEGQELLLSNEFENLSIKDAAILFAKLCFESGYIPTGASIESGKVLQINFDGTLEDYTDLKTLVLDEVNKYFYANGIIAKALGTITDNLKLDLGEIYQLAEQNSRTEEEILQEIALIIDNIKDAPLSNREEFASLYLEYQNKISEYSKITTEYLNAFKAQIQILSPIITQISDETANQIFESLENIAESNTIQQLDVTIQNFYKEDFEIDSRIANIINEMMEDIKEQLRDSKEDLKEFQRNLKKEYKTKFEKLVDNHKNTIDTLKESFNQKIENNKENIENHNEYFQENRSEVYALIEEFRTSQNI